MKKTIHKNTLLLMLIVILETVIIKSVQYRILPNKYFYDSGKILQTMYSSMKLDSSYQYAVEFFEKINFLKLTTLQQWSIVISSAVIPFILYFLSKNKQYKMHQLIFIIASVALLNIYVFNISKDIIQFFYFSILYLILKSKFENLTKLILCCMVLLYEALHFRIYYAIMAMILVTIYFTYHMFIKDKLLNKKHIIKIVLLFIFAFFIEVFFVQLISTSNYEAILNARYGVNRYRQDSLDAVTIINDALGQNSSFLVFCFNYLINFLRMNIPIELLFKGIKYIPFILYQIYILIQVGNGIKKLNNKNLLLVAVIISFIMISVIFEPDFGSFIRHETPLMLILLELSKINDENLSEKNE